MSALGRILAWYRGRGSRERAMLATMALLLAAFAWWYGLLWPLRALRDGTEARHDRAAAALQAIEAEVAALTASGAAVPPPSGGEALQRRILDDVRDAGLAPSRQRSAADGAFVLEFERVGSAELFGWLGGLAGHGLAPSSLRVERADGQLRAEVGFGGVAP
ncbi:type II secretion system protein GspM [Luteimonas granuli]|uniref:Type II secretion system protein M n=1 Tax=Luteimonas granuli TaxID=1176533 RepID=A0A518N270_9GAMM|nr:type II secretion system protein GspM [Luteimonas granuli]QDW65998.1 type II secretion system protein M [Luteimonas granuli]